jgi:hypothetical protein
MNEFIICHFTDKFKNSLSISFKISVKESINIRFSDINHFFEYISSNIGF